ncbi:methyl-accepting chemotaxis protein, partial [Marinobacter sp. B9-2]
MNVLSRLKIRTRLLVAVMVPVLLTAATLAWITASQIQANGEEELKRLENSLLEARKAGLQNLVDAAKAVVLEAKNDPSLSEEEAKEAAAARLRTIRFDETNYVFAYTRDVYNLAYAPDPSKEGPTNNPTLKRLVGDLFAAAEEDGFYGYDWMNPASGNEEPKMSSRAAA